MKLQLDEKVSIIIDKSIKNEYYLDEVDVYIEINNKKLFITKDSFSYEISNILNNSFSNPLQVDFNNIGEKYFEECIELSKRLDSFEIDEIFNHNGLSLFDDNNVVVFIYKYLNKNLYLVSKIDIENKIYKELASGELNDFYRKRCLEKLSEADIQNF